MKLNKVAIDAGNAACKFIAGQYRFLAPSCSYRLAAHEVRRTRGTPKSPLVSIEQEHYLIGELAIERLGTNNFATSDKLLQLNRFLFASLPPQPYLDIDRLLVAVPDDFVDGQQEILDRLVGVHDYTRNGVKSRVAIGEVVAVAETYSAYAAAIGSKLFRDPNRRNGIVTIGGGTVNLALLDSSGNILPEYSCVVNKGLRSLALKISSAIACKSNVSIDAVAVMSAIGNGLTIASRIDFADVFESCRESWVDDIRAVIIEKWASQINEIGEVVITGAPAPLLADYVATRGGRFKIPTNPQWFAVEGMLL